MDTHLNVNTKRAYKDLADYAAQQGAPESAFAAAGWKQTTYKNRPALRYSTKTGDRWRYLDGKEPRHDSPFGYKPSWYGLEKAYELATDENPIVMVNGAAGVIVAQYCGVPAFAVSDGETREISPDMLLELKKAWLGKIAIALDCDEAGRKSAQKRARQLIAQGYKVRILDLQLGKNGDIADFCKVYGSEGHKRLQELPEIVLSAPEKTYKLPEGTEALASDDQYARRIAAKWLDNNLDELTRAKSGRRRTLLSVATKIGGLVKGGYISNSESIRGLINAAAICGLIDKYGEKEIQRTIADCFKAAKATAIERPNKTVSKARSTKNPQRKYKSNIIKLPTYTADLSVSMPYITELKSDFYLGKKTLALKSGTGTGKTEFFKRLIEGLPHNANVLIITHRVSLVKGIARRLGIQDYQDFTEFAGKDKYLVGSAWQIVSTVDSLHLQAGRRFDFIFIDEAGQTLRHLSSAGTLGKRTIDTYEILKQLVSDAGNVWYADANLSDYDIQWLQAIRNDVYTIENTYRHARANTIALDSQLEATQVAIDQIAAGKGTVLIACATQRTLRHIHKLLTERFPDKKGRFICSRNSNTADTKSFIADVANNAGQLPEDLDWLIYTHSMGTGVDIQSPVAATIGILGSPLTPADDIQMMGRARHAKQRFAYVPNSVGMGETNPNILLAYELLASEENSHFGTLLPDANTKGAARLETIYRAQRNQELIAYRAYFEAYSAADGSRVVSGRITVAKGLKSDLKQIAKAEKERIKSLALDTINVPAIEDELLEKLRRNGEEITDTLVAGNLRYKIESTAGIEISDDIYMRYRTDEQRKQFIRFCSLIDEKTALEERDRQDGVKRLPLHLRPHYASARKLFMKILKEAFDIEGIEALKTVLNDMPKNELEERVKFIGQKYAKEIRAFFKWRPAIAAQIDNYVGLFRWICQRFKLVISGRRTTRNGEKIWLYSLNSTEFDAEMLNARTRLALRKITCHINQKNPLFNNVDTTYVEKCPSIDLPIYEVSSPSNQLNEPGLPKGNKYKAHQNSFRGLALQATTAVSALGESGRK